MKHKAESKTKEKELNRVRAEVREARGQAQQFQEQVRKLQVSSAQNQTRLSQ
jgi:hypothetical protein